MQQPKNLVLHLMLCLLAVVLAACSTSAPPEPTEVARQAINDQSTIVSRAQSWVNAGYGYSNDYIGPEGYRLDCSGLVGFAWGVSKYMTTGTTKDYAKYVLIDDLQPGDAVNTEGGGLAAHMVLFVGWASGWNGNQRIMTVIEENGALGAVRHNYTIYKIDSGALSIPVLAPYVWRDRWVAQRSNAIIEPPAGWPYGIGSAPQGGWQAWQDDTVDRFQRLAHNPDSLQYWWDESTTGGNGRSAFTFSVAGESVDDYGKWTYTVPSDGIYDLYTFIPKPSYTNMPYTGLLNQMASNVRYQWQGGEVAAVDQQANEGRWVKLASNLQHKAGQDYTVTAGDAVGGAPIELRVYFDALALQRVGDLPDLNNYPPAGFTQCATEGGRCTFTGQAEVVFGARKAFTLPKAFTSSVDCNTATFGDPMPGVVKACYLKAIIPAPSIGTGSGLLGEYYNTVDFTGMRVLARNESTINLNWAAGSPDPKVQVDNFSARYTGDLQAKYDGEWTFSVEGDDGFRLWVNGALVVDHWVLGGFGTEYTGKINLNAGQKYPIKLELFEAGGSAGVVLRWSHIYQGKEVIPTSQLYPAVAAQDQLQASVGTLTFPQQTVGDGVRPTMSFTVKNAGTLTTPLTVTDTPEFTASTSLNLLKGGESATLTVKASPCTVAGSRTGTVTVTGTSSSQQVKVSQRCVTAPTLNTPSAPTLNLSSNGRIQLNWAEVTGASKYVFKVTFDGQPLDVTGEPASKGEAYLGGVATWTSNPQASEKQNKAICFQLRAVNAQGSSAFGPQGCVNYRYYDGDIVITPNSLLKLGH